MNPDPIIRQLMLSLKRTCPVLPGMCLTFTIGRGNDICCMAIDAMRHLVVGSDLETFKAAPGKFWRHLTGDSQLRWIGPDKGAMHLATGAVVNAFWDLLAKQEGKPVWRLVADMSPEEIADIVDYRYLTDALTRDEAIAILKKAESGKAERIAILEREGYACYTTSAGWLGYDDEKLRRLCQKRWMRAFNHIKMKVGRDLEDDIRRLRIAREVIGPDRYLMIDANQVWEVDQAIDWVKQLSFCKPFFIEEPTSPDDVAGPSQDPPVHISGKGGNRRNVPKPHHVQAVHCRRCDRHCADRQLPDGRVERGAGRSADCREVWSAGVAACRRVGLCEYVQHLSMIDYVAVSGTKEGRVIEYVDHLHEHFLDPCRIENAAYMPPSLPGFSIEMKPETLAEFQFATTKSSTGDSRPG